MIAGRKLIRGDVDRSWGYSSRARFARALYDYCNWFSLENGKRAYEGWESSEPVGSGGVSPGEKAHTRAQAKEARPRREVSYERSREASSSKCIWNPLFHAILPLHTYINHEPRPITNNNSNRPIGLNRNHQCDNHHNKGADPTYTSNDGPYNPTIGVASIHCVLKWNVWTSTEQFVMLDNHGEEYRCIAWLNLVIST
jgi:hypothetical protein